MTFRPEFLLVALWPGLAAAQHVEPCQARVDAALIVEPWEDYTRSFANGAVRVALLDEAEPFGGNLYFLVLTPPYVDGRRTCARVGWEPGHGFATVGFTGMAPAFDPAKGLSLGMQARFFDPETQISNAGVLYVGIDLANGVVTATFEITTGE